MLETEPDETDIVMRHLGTAIPLQVNLAISGGARLAREVRTAVRRRKQEEIAARRAAVSTLQCELNGTVTALLLSCELALDAPGLPVAATEKIESAHALVKKLRSQLESTLAQPLRTISSQVSPQEGDLPRRVFSSALPPPETGWNRGRFHRKNGAFLQEKLGSQPPHP